MSTGNVFDFLWQNTDQAPATTKLPEGGGVAGFAGQWVCSVVYRFWSDKKPEEYGQTYDGKRSTNSGAFYYFRSQETALAVGKAVGQEYPPNTVWRWEIPTNTVLTSIGDKMGDVITQEVSITTLMSKKSRHELHMLTLPSAVQALALLGSMIDKTIFDYESLRVDPDMIDDAYQDRVIGTGNDYENSELWQARTALWAALDEHNAKAYTVNQGKFDATSDKLRSCLNIIYRPTTLWARLVSVPDPRVDATYNDGEKRLSVPIVAQIWRDKTGLMRDLELEEKTASPASSNSRNGANGHAANGNLPKLPAVWADYPSDWTGVVREIIKPLNGKPKPIMLAELQKMADQLQQSYGATPEDFIAWSEHV